MSSVMCHVSRVTCHMSFFTKSANWADSVQQSQCPHLDCPFLMRFSLGLSQALRSPDRLDAPHWRHQKSVSLIRTLKRSIPCHILMKKKILVRLSASVDSVSPVCRIFFYKVVKLVSGGSVFNGADPDKFKVFKCQTSLLYRPLKTIKLS